MQSEAFHPEILNDLRARICLAPHGSPFVIHENEVAASHGVSRSPVRQVLQRLALEGFVEVKVGVGTVARELVPEERARAFSAYREIAAGAANCAQGDGVPDAVKVDLLGLYNLMSFSDGKAAADYVRIFGEVGGALAALIADDVLRNALRVAHWRVVRWRTQDFHKEPGETWQSLRSNVERVVEGVRQNNAAVILRTAAGISDSFARSA
jgi:DNA-binding GntR family transcriptional regulator